MYLKLSQHTDPVKGFRLEGQPERADFRSINHHLLEAIEQYGSPLCVLIEVDPGSAERDESKYAELWDDLKYSLHHWGEISHLALVAPEAALAQWQDFSSRLAQLSVRCFKSGDLHQAWEWLRAAHQRCLAEAQQRDQAIPQPQPYVKVLAAIDLAPSSVYVARCAQRAAQQSDAQLVLMHVIDFEPTVALGYGWEVAANVDHDPREFEQPAAERLQSFAKQAGLEDAQLVVSTGDPRFRILETCEEEGVDLIVIGSRARRGLERLLGSTAHGVVHRASCDVLTVKIPRD